MLRLIELIFEKEYVSELEKWSSLVVNICFTLLFIFSTFSLNIRKNNKNCFFILAAIAYSFPVFIVLFIKTPSIADYKQLFFLGFLYFCEYAVLYFQSLLFSVKKRADLPPTENIGDFPNALKQTDNSQIKEQEFTYIPSTDKIMPNLSTYYNTQLKKDTPHIIPKSNSIPTNYYNFSTANDKKESPNQKNKVKKAAICEISLKEIEKVKMHSSGSLNEEYALKCLNSIDKSLLPEKQREEYERLRKDIFENENFFSCNDKKQISEKCGRLIYLLALKERAFHTQAQS